eukprot:scaffold74797_cov54-Attheya_sp.AAC.1
MLVDYAATELGCLDHYSDSVSNGKTIQGLGAASLLLHIAQCFSFQQTKHVTMMLISEHTLTSFYAQLGFKKIIEFKTAPRYKEARERFHYRDDTDEQKILPFVCYQTIPRRVTKLHDGRYIGLRDELFKSLNVSTPNEEWFPLDFIKETIEEIHTDEALKLDARKEVVGQHYLKLLNAGANKNINISHELD